MPVSEIGSKEEEEKPSAGAGGPPPALPKSHTSVEGKRVSSLGYWPFIDGARIIHSSKNLPVRKALVTDDPGNPAQTLHVAVASFHH